MAEKPKKVFGYRQPRTTSDEENFGGLLGDDMETADVIGTVAKYGIPLAVLLQQSKAAKRLREDSKVDLEEPELNVGRVRSMRRPNFGLRRREPAGSSLAEMVAGQKYGDAFQRDQEIQFEMNDDASRIAQENQVLDRTNQNTLVKNQIRNQERMQRGNVAAQELLGLNIPFQQEALLGLYHNVQSDVSQNAYVGAMERSQAAAAVLTNPASSAEERQAASDYIMGKLGKGSKGGKLSAKSKFYGK